MKKILLATTLIVAASSAMAEVSISGYGRFGMVYNSAPGAGFTTTRLATRMRLNINAKMTTDGGVDFGGRIRLQYDQGKGAAALSPAMLYAESNGLRLEVGNVNTAYDSAALFYNSEVGFTDASVGEGDYGYNSFSTGSYGSNRMGIFASYASGPMNVRVSYVTPDQTVKTQAVGAAAETGISADYTFGAFTVSGAYVNNAAMVKGAKENFIGVAYAMSSTVNVGLNHYHTQTSGNTTTLYGNYAMGAITLKGYVTNNDLNTNKNKTVAGIGADYALGGGARLSGSIRPNFDGTTSADLGVRFDF